LRRAIKQKAAREGILDQYRLPIAVVAAGVEVTNGEHSSIRLARETRASQSREGDRE
jgi:hypothetical protein